jgi:hypothetical protein
MSFSHKRRKKYDNIWPTIAENVEKCFDTEWNIIIFVVMQYLELEPIQEPRALLLNLQLPTMPAL